MLAVDGLLDPEAGQTLLAALEPLARPAGAEDGRSGWQRNADALAELARRSLEGGRLPRTGGVRPQLLVTVDLATLLGHHDSLGGELGWTGSVGAESCRRLACDADLTRVLVTRGPHGHPDGSGTSNHRGSDGATGHPGGDGEGWDGSRDGQAGRAGGAGEGGLAARLQAARRLLPPALGGRRPSRWRSAAPPGPSPAPSAPPWWCGMVAAGFPGVIGRRAGVRPTTCATGCTAAPPTWPT
jgi:hypothetical protein